MEKSVNFEPGSTMPFMNTVNTYLLKEVDSEKRIDCVKWHLMNSLFDQFENVERENLHEIESEKLLLEILCNIAKARVEKKKELVIRDGFDSTEIKFKGKNTQQVVNKDNINDLFLRKSSSEYYHGFASVERILHERKIGILYMTILKFLKRRKNISVVIATSERLPLIIFSWRFQNK